MHIEPFAPHCSITRTTHADLIIHSIMTQSDKIFISLYHSPPILYRKIVLLSRPPVAPHKAAALALIKQPLNIVMINIDSIVFEPPGRELMSRFRSMGRYGGIRRWAVGHSGGLDDSKDKLTRGLVVAAGPGCSGEPEW